jgi:predicted glycosyltransferase
MKIALYSHDAMGLGHFRRNLLLARRFLDSPMVSQALLVAGTPEVSAFPLPLGVNCLTLPALRKNANGSYAPRSGGRLSDLIELRSRTLFSALRTFGPDVLVVEKHPRGILCELEPILAWLSGRARLVLGLRDILDAPEAVSREWTREESFAAIREYFDALWIYGDPSLYDPRREYRFPPDIAEKTRFVGYLDPTVRLREEEARLPRELGDMGKAGLALCLVGGGQDGASLARRFARALPPGLAGVIITGPFMPPEDHRKLRRLTDRNADLRVIPFTLSPGAVLRRADRVVSMGGYNTVCEVLVAGKPLLVVPRIRPREEQMIRASRLAELGLLSLMHPDRMTTADLSRWIRTPVPPSMVPQEVVDFRGLARLPGILGRTVREQAPLYSLRRTG